MYFTKPFIWFHTSSYLITPLTNQSFEWAKCISWNIFQMSSYFLPPLSFRLSHIALEYNFLKYPDIFGMYPYYGIHYCKSIHCLYQTWKWITIQNKNDCYQALVGFTVYLHWYSPNYLKACEPEILLVCFSFHFFFHPDANLKMGERLRHEHVL